MAERSAHAQREALRMVLPEFVWETQQSNSDGPVSIIATFASQLATKGESLYKISKLMGNSPEIAGDITGRFYLMN
jgi:hypothetical protein